MVQNKNQNGMTFLVVVLFLAIFISIIYLGMKFIPPYLNNYMLKGIIKSIVLKNQRYDDSMPIEEYQQAIRSEFDKRLLINNIDSVKAKNITVTPNSNGFQVHVSYNIQTHLFGNMDALIHFQNTIEVANAKS